MKILSLTAVLAVALLGLASCNKQYDVEVADSNTITNNGGSGGGFNWTGTEPISAKVNGVSWLATTISFNTFAGYYAVLGKADDGTSIGLSVPISAQAGQVFSAPSPANVGYTDPALVLSTMASPGKIKVVKNDADILEGYFQAETKSPIKPDIVKLTEGYFKVEKP